MCLLTKDLFIYYSLQMSDSSATHPVFGCTKWGERCGRSSPLVLPDQFNCGRLRFLDLLRQDQNIYDSERLSDLDDTSHAKSDFKDFEYIVFLSIILVFNIVV